MRHFLLCFVLCSFFATEASANAPWRENHLRKRKKQEAFAEALAAIPVHRERLEPVEILGPVHGQDALSNKKDAILYQMRKQAHLMGADAIMEFKCDSLKGVFQDCHGFAVRRAHGTGGVGDADPAVKLK